MDTGGVVGISPGHSFKSEKFPGPRPPQKTTHAGAHHTHHGDSQRGRRHPEVFTVAAADLGGPCHAVCPHDDGRCCHGLRPRPGVASEFTRPFTSSAVGLGSDAPLGTRLVLSGMEPLARARRAPCGPAGIPHRPAGRDPHRPGLVLLHRRGHHGMGHGACCHGHELAGDPRSLVLPARACSRGRPRWLSLGRMTAALTLASLPG